MKRAFLIGLLAIVIVLALASTTMAAPKPALTAEDAANGWAVFTSGDATGTKVQSSGGVTAMSSGAWGWTDPPKIWDSSRRAWKSYKWYEVGYYEIGYVNVWKYHVDVTWWWYNGKIVDIYVARQGIIRTAGIGWDYGGTIESARQLSSTSWYQYQQAKFTFGIKGIGVTKLPWITFTADYTGSIHGNWGI